MIHRGHPLTAYMSSIVIAVEKFARLERKHSLYSKPEIVYL